MAKQQRPRYEEESMSLPEIRRKISDLKKQMHQAAEEMNFEKAAKLRADRVSHQIELGRTYAMLGRKDDARQRIEQGLNMPSRERDDPETKLRGRETLEKL